MKNGLDGLLPQVGVAVIGVMIGFLVTIALVALLSLTQRVFSGHPIVASRAHAMELEESQQIEKLAGNESCPCVDDKLFWRMAFKLVKSQQLHEIAHQSTDCICSSSRQPFR